MDYQKNNKSACKCKIKSAGKSKWWCAQKIEHQQSN